MTKYHIVPPFPPSLELVRSWAQARYGADPETLWRGIANEAAQWGWDQREPEIQAAADQELEECINFVYDNELCEPDFHEDLRAARRPKPPSLKKQALTALMNIQNKVALSEDQEIIRRALEALPDE